MAAGHPLLMVGGGVPFWRQAIGVPVANLHSSVAGNGVFLAFSYSNNEIAKTTDNGATWSNVTGTSASTWTQARYAYNGSNHVYLACRNGGFQHSVDAGATWTATNDGLNHQTLAWSPTLGMFNAITYNSNSGVRSTTGTGGWGAVSMPSVQNWNFLVWDPQYAQFVAMSTGNGKVAVSSDGITYTAVADSGLASFTGGGMAAGNGIIVGTIGGTRDAFSSSDGAATWQTHTNVIPGTDLFMGSPNYNTVAFSGSYFISQSIGDAVGMSTTNGSVWNTQELSLGVGSGRSAAAANGKYFLTLDYAPYVLQAG